MTNQLSRLKVALTSVVDHRRCTSSRCQNPAKTSDKIREQIFDEIKRIATDGPTEAEMEKLRNSLCNDAVRGRQSTMYRAQRLAEFALYDSDPNLVDSELDHYLALTADDIKNAIARYVDVDNRVVLDIIPAPAADVTEDVTASASPQTPGDPHQPAAPPPQVPDVPTPEPESPVHAEIVHTSPSEQPKDPADVPPQTKPGPVHYIHNMSQTEIFRSQAPAPLPPRPISIPTPRETTLPNGLSLVVVEDSRLPLVSYRLAFPVGGAFDPPGLPGLTDLLAGLLPEGTQSRTSKEIADEVARMGASLSAGATSDYTIVGASALAQFNDQILDLMAEVILEPSFPENEVELAKQNTKESLRQQRAQPSFLASEMVSRVMFGDHPYSIVAPTPESIDRCTRDDFVEFHRSKLVPNNAFFIVVGDVRYEDIVNRLESLFSTWERGEEAGGEFSGSSSSHEKDGVSRRSTGLGSVKHRDCKQRHHPDQS